MAGKCTADAIRIEGMARVPVSLHCERGLSSNDWKLAHHQVLDGISIWGPLPAVSQQEASRLLLFCLVLSFAPALAHSEDLVLNLQTIVDRMAQSRAENRARFRPYIVTRDYKLFGKKQHEVKSQVIADVTFVPPNVKNFAIEESSGAGLGERAVRRILQSEAEAAKVYDATDYSQANYDFRYIREEQDASGQHSYVLELLPKREEKILLRGKLWVDAETYYVHRFEGEPAKPSSWWVQEVHITLLYGDVDGMWLQTGMEAAARVRILGPHRMVANDLKYKISPRVATAGNDAEIERRADPNRIKRKPAEQGKAPRANAFGLRRMDSVGSNP
jgi:hypothetical protein